jgi:hypothetical protein
VRKKTELIQPLVGISQKELTKEYEQMHQIRMMEYDEEIKTRPSAIPSLGSQFRSKKERELKLQ